MSSSDLVEHRLKVLEEAIIKLTHVQEDLTEIQLTLAKSEVRDAQNTDLLLDLDTRVKALEVARPGHDQAAKWMSNAIWAAAAAAVMFVWQSTVGDWKK